MKTIPEAVAAHEVALAFVAQHFGLESVWYELVAHLECPWVEHPSTVGLWGGNEEGLFDPDDLEYEADKYGTARWETDEYTLFHVYNNGSKEAWLFTNSFKVELE